MAAFQGALVQSRVIGEEPPPRREPLEADVFDRMTSIDTRGRRARKSRGSAAGSAASSMASSAMSSAAGSAAGSEAPTSLSTAVGSWVAGGIASLTGGGREAVAVQPAPRATKAHRGGARRPRERRPPPPDPTVEALTLPSCVRRPAGPRPAQSYDFDDAGPRGRRAPPRGGPRGGPAVRRSPPSQAAGEGGSRGAGEEGEASPQGGGGATLVSAASAFSESAETLLTTLPLRAGESKPPCGQKPDPQLALD